MEYWFQRILLNIKYFVILFFCTCISSTFAEQASEGSTIPEQSVDIDTEYFDVGIFTGLLNIEDFNSELVKGINMTFNANEDFFIQFNYLEANASLSSFELSQGRFFAEDDRTFTHFDFLLGYNLFLGEHFMSDSITRLSSFYLVAGIGDTEFGGEESFTYTLGLGYQIAVQRNILVRIDFRDYIYKTNIIGENNSTHNTQLSAGVSFLF